MEQGLQIGKRVPSGTLPKFGEGPHSLIEKPLDPLKKKRTMKRWASLLPATVISSCEPACCRWVFVRQKLCTQDWYGTTLSSFTGNHSVWLDLFVYRCISLDTQELYHLMSLIGFGIGQASLIFGQSLIEVIGQYHLGQARYILGCHFISGITGWTLSSFNKQHLYLENIQHYWMNKLLYLVILIDEYYYLDEQCSWISLLESTSHHFGQTLCRTKLLLDCYHSHFYVLWNNWMTIALTYYLEWTMFASHHSYTEVTSRDRTHVTSDDHHIPSQLWNNTTSLSANDMFGYRSYQLMS